ncbi:hypothetical protein BDZ89DRAFT_1073056 [Hymenopellis radicata]|nr:hypothetical protein BDZ89DRAFT_1073056 [Hymenopellis radicata]
MSVDPTAIVSMIEQCVKIYEYIEAVKESSEERRRFMQEVGALRDVLGNLQGLLRDQAFAQDRSSMAPLQLLFDPNKPFIELMERDLWELEQKLVGGTKKNRTRLRSLLSKMVAAGTWPLEKAESKALLARLERHKSLVSLAMQHDVNELIREVRNMIADSNGKLSDVEKAFAPLLQVIGVAISYEERHKVAEWISKITFSAYHAENSRKWLKGTGRWVLESPEFQKWASKTSSSPTLWCYGNAGAGKSVIAAMIVEHLRSIPGNVVLVIVCRYNQDRKYLQETHTFMCCLLRQLLQLEASSTIPQYLLDLYRKDIHPSEDSVRMFLIEAARIVSRPTFIVLDALDECPLGFDLVAAIQRLGGDFNLLITSRPVFAQRYDYPSLRIRAADGDILAAINDKIPALPYVREDEALQTTVRTAVVANANGMFLLASLMLWELEHDVTNKADVRKVLASIPASLNDAYRLIFERIGILGARKKKLALQSIIWICTESQSKFMLHVHLTYSVLRVLLACEISPSEPEFQEDHMPPLLDIINACGGLLSATSLGCQHNGHDSEEGWAACCERSTKFSFIHYSAYEYISHFQPSVLPQDPYEFTFNICTIALRHIEHIGDDHRELLRHLWMEKATFMDCRQPALVQSALANTNFNEGWEMAVDTYYMAHDSRSLGLGLIRPWDWPEWLKTLVSKRDSDINSLDYAALFGLRGTFRLARETKALDEHVFQRAMEILVTCHHWDLVHEVWARGEYDINAYCEKIGSTAICELLSTADSFRFPKELNHAFIQHPSTSLRCPRHDGLLGCAIAGWIPWDGDRRPADTAMILKRLYHDTKDGPSQPGRISVYPPPGCRRSHLPDILDVIAVFLQRADIDLDADITQMVPPEMLLALLMLPWDPDGFYINEEAKDVLRPYARRPVDVPADTSTSNHVPDADALTDHVVPDTARAVEATDTCATTEPGRADSTPAHVPSSEVLLDDRVVPDTARRALEAVDTYHMTAVLLVVGAAIFLLYLSVPPAALSHSPW